ncbi:hypothetical protein D3C81_2248200 [compost metagenome]
MPGKGGIQRVVDGRRVDADINDTLPGKPFSCLVIQSGVSGQPFVCAVGAVIMTGVEQHNVSFVEMKITFA